MTGPCKHCVPRPDDGTGSQSEVALSKGFATPSPPRGKKAAPLGGKAAWDENTHMTKDKWRETSAVPYRPASLKR